MIKATFISRQLLVAAASAAAVATLHAVPVTAQEPSLQARLQALEDKEAVRTTLERYTQYQEARDYESYSRLFAADGELVLRRETATGGPPGILATMLRDYASAGAPGGPLEGMRHLLSNVRIDVNGDTATAESRWTMLMPNEDGGARVGGTGRYIDTLVREDGEWRFKRRVIARDIPADE